MWATRRDMRSRENHRHEHTNEKLANPTVIPSFLIRFFFFPFLLPPSIPLQLRHEKPTPAWRYDEMKNPYFTFLRPDNFYATAEDIDPQLLTESIKSFKSQARDTTVTVRRKAAAAAGSSSASAAAARQAPANRNRQLQQQQQQYYSNHINHKR